MGAATDRGHRRIARTGTIVGSKRALGALWAVLAIALAACGDAPPIEPVGHDPLSLRYTCGTFPFGPELLAAGPGRDELANTGPAAALRRYLASPARVQHRVPEHGWRLFGSDAERAEFGSSVLGGMWIVVVRMSSTGWVASAPDTCQPHLVLPAGLGQASWTIDPAQPRPAPMTQVFDALVTERACANGGRADARVVGPQVVRSTDVVLVIFAVRPRGEGGRCPASPATPVTVDLGETLGSRVLLDGGRLPFGDPSAPV